MFRYLFLILLILAGSGQTRAQEKRFSFTRAKMGSPFTIILYTGDSTQATTIAERSFQLVDSLVLIFSDYIDSSELNRLCGAAGPHNKPMIISPALFEILSLSKYAYEKSNGTFDITLGPVTRLWRKARKENVFPPNNAVQEKLKLTGFIKLKLNKEKHTAHLVQKGMQLDLGGIAQGYIAQQVIGLIKLSDIDNALVDVSGDIIAIGAPPDTKGWTIGINAPGEDNKLLKKTLLISGNAVTTSGDLYQFIYHNGKKYSHIIDPKTGYGITSQKNVTVIASDGTTADWLTKACSLLPITNAKKLATELNAALLIVELKNDKMMMYANKEMEAFWKH
ncbi:MAG: FAD:protein FMN transferase [Ferruginibacter sp.]